jgi:DNA primase
MKVKQELTIGRRKIPVTNLEKVLYPAAHFTKSDVIDYDIRLADFILPHLRHRPVTLKRFPNGTVNSSTKKTRRAALSGRTMEQIRLAGDAVWNSCRAA